jgi:preprotein translocase subunit SecE
MADEQSSNKLTATGDAAAAAESRTTVDVADRAPAKSGRQGGYFTIYKRGQGYWTRMGTALAAGVLSVLIAHYIYSHMRAFPITGADGKPTYIDTRICLSVGGVVLALLLWFCWSKINKPANVDFLIATDSEMKKVNWTTRKELIGSTKVVVFFVILISAILFLYDLVFGYFFQLIRVLQFGPFQ